MLAYKESIGMGKEDKPDEPEKTESASGENARDGMKYILLGFLGGIFVYCGFFGFCYVMSDAVKSEEEMKRLYTFPFYGKIPVSGGNEKNSREMAGECKDSCERSKVQVVNRLRLVCRKKGITKLCAASDFLFDAREKECLECMAEQLKSWGIDLAVAENAMMDTAGWDELTGSGNVLMVCRMGTTTHRMIDNAMYFYLENGIHVTGAAAFS